MSAKLVLSIQVSQAIQATSLSCTTVIKVSSNGTVRCHRASLAPVLLEPAGPAGRHGGLVLPT